MRISVTTSLGQTVIVECQPDSTVEEIKQQMMIVEGLPVNVQILMCQHQRLENHLQLSDYRIGDMAHLSVLFRLGGQVDPNN
jgi:hypothetical protein